MITSSFPAVNVGVFEEEVQLPNIGMRTNYALAGFSSNKASFDNKTCGASKEVLTVKSDNIKKVDTLASVDAPTAAAGVQYSVRYDTVLQTVDSENPDFLMEEPIVVTIGIRHQKSDHWSADDAALVEEALFRAIGGFYYATNQLGADKHNRFNDLMRGQENPTVGY